MTLGARLGPLPTTFVGRRSMLEALAASVERARLTTVVGAPGVGKTRLVREHLLALDGGAAAHATIFCDLTEAITLSGAIARVASATATDSVAPSDDAKQAIEAALRARGPALVVLDNFEQLVQPARGLVQELLERTPERTRFVVTSRERLGVPGESVVELPPLALPDEAVELFVARARSALPSFDPGAAELSSIGELVRLLDGLPLAIELAAARIPMLTPAELVARIERRFEWLTSSHDTLRARPATLREVIDASWALLTPSDRAALAQVATFRGGFTVAAAEEVVDLRALDGPSVLDALQSLRDKSLLQAQPGEGARRFVVLASIRELAEPRLSAEERDAVHLRHARYFLSLGERLGAELDTSDDPSAYRELHADHENFVAVHERFAGRRDSPEPNASLRAALILARTGSSLAYAVTLDVLDRALEDAGTSDPLLVSRALEARGNARRFVGRTRESVLDFERMLALAEAAGDERLRASALSGLGNAATVRADWAEARGLFERALAILGAIGDRRAEGRVLAMLAATSFNQDDPAAARALLERALARVRDANDRAFEGICVTSLGAVALALGSQAEARRALREALALHQEAGARHWEGVTLSYLALAEQEAGRLVEARALHAGALALLGEIGVRRAEALALAAAAGTSLLSGELDEARVRYRRAIELARVMCPDHEGLFLACLGAVAALEGDLVAASDAFDGADAALAGHRRPGFEAALGVHRGQLALARGGEGAAERAREHLSSAGAWVERSTEARFARDLLAAVLRAVEHDPGAGALVVGASGVWFKAPRSPTVVRLQRRRALHRLVHVLAERRTREPGAAVSIPELIERGWPGERVLPDAGTERVYTAIATLRKLGLRPVLLQADDGYLLDPRVELTWSAQSPPR